MKEQIHIANDVYTSRRLWFCKDCRQIVVKLSGKLYEVTQDYIDGQPQGYHVVRFHPETVIGKCALEMLP